MFNNFNLNVCKILKSAEKEMLKMNHPYVGSEHLLLSLLNSENEINDYFLKNNITYKRFKDELIRIVGRGTYKSEVILYTPLLKRSIDNAIGDAKETNNGVVKATHLFLGILEEGEGIAIRLLMSLNFDLDKAYKDLKTGKNNMSKELSIYEIGSLLNDKINMNEKVVGRDSEITSIIEILLRKNKNNPLLIGKAGVGKTAIVEELTRRINNDLVPSELLNKKIISLEMGSLIAGTKYRGEFEERLNKIINEILKQKNIILFIDEIHTLVGAGGAEGAIDASNILKPYLARGEIKCIGATTIDEYNRHINKDKALERRFQIVDVNEPDRKQTEYILKCIKKTYEKHHNLKITEQNIKDIVTYADKYIFTRNNPDKCIDILDSVCARVNVKKSGNNFHLREKELIEVTELKKRHILNHEYDKAIKLKSDEVVITKDLAKLKKKADTRIISEADIIEVIKSKTNMPFINDIDNVIELLRNNLSQKIYEQKEAVNEVFNQIKYKLSNYSNKPLSMLFVGPSGVGKTETAKVISESLLGGKNLIRLDMSEYNLETSVNKLIGSSAGYVGYNDETILSQVKRNPFSIILLDEIEKASNHVMNLFLQILDEGFITDNKGEKLYFNNAIIIMTSNISKSNINGFGISNKIDLSENVSTELMNRINKVIQYQQFSKQQIKQYIKSKLIKISVTELDNMLQESDYQKYGLRNVNRLIEKHSTYKIEQKV